MLILSFRYTGFASTYIGRIVKSISSSFNTEFDLEQVRKLRKALLKDTKKLYSLSQLRDFQSAHSTELGSSTRAVEQAVEAVENNVKWMEENYNVVADWLNSQVY